MRYPICPDPRPAISPELREERRAQKLAAYHRRMADPAFREARARYERQRWANGEGARRNAIYRADSASIQEFRTTSSNEPTKAVPKQELTPERAAYKRAWQRDHAEELNARRHAARLANPQKFRAQEQASKRRRRERLKRLKETALQALKLLPDVS